MAHVAKELKDNLYKLKAAEQGREKLRKSRRRVFHSGGALYVGDAR
jgi:hypothetical protein